MFDCVSKYMQIVGVNSLGKANGYGKILREARQPWKATTLIAIWELSNAPHAVPRQRSRAVQGGAWAEVSSRCALVSAEHNGVHRSMANESLSSPEKDPEDWVTGAEPMTGPQRSYLETLAREAGEDVPADLTKAQASEVIDRLQQKTGRGR
ncbi:MAG: hypothetical protein QOJ06_2937 [Pseudonocardiales bacterium]|jgi:hypothetical protein|nr:hypothetical protein [Pseudonocardiales bacterium]